MVLEAARSVGSVVPKLKPPEPTGDPPPLQPGQSRPDLKTGVPTPSVASGGSGNSEHDATLAEVKFSPAAEVSLLVTPCTPLEQSTRLQLCCQQGPEHSPLIRRARAKVLDSESDRDVAGPASPARSRVFDQSAPAQLSTKAEDSENDGQARHPAACLPRSFIRMLLHQVDKDVTQLPEERRATHEETFKAYPLYWYCDLCGQPRRRHGVTKNTIQLKCYPCNSTRSYMKVRDELVAIYNKAHVLNPTLPEGTSRKRAEKPEPTPGRNFTISHVPKKPTVSSPLRAQSSVATAPHSDCPWQSAEQNAASDESDSVEQLMAQLQDETLSILAQETETDSSQSIALKHHSYDPYTGMSELSKETGLPGRPKDGGGDLPLEPPSSPSSSSTATSRFWADADEWSTEEEEIPASWEKEQLSHQELFDYKKPCVDTATVVPAGSGNPDMSPQEGDIAGKQEELEEHSHFVFPQWEWEARGNCAYPPSSDPAQLSGDMVLVPVESSNVDLAQNGTEPMLLAEETGQSDQLGSLQAIGSGLKTLENKRAQGTKAASEPALEQRTAPQAVQARTEGPAADAGIMVSQDPVSGHSADYVRSLELRLEQAEEQISLLKRELSTLKESLAASKATSKGSADVSAPKVPSYASAAAVSKFKPLVNATVKVPPSVAAIQARYREAAITKLPQAASRSLTNSSAQVRGTVAALDATSAESAVESLVRTVVKASPSTGRAQSIAERPIKASPRPNARAPMAANRAAMANAETAKVATGAAKANAGTVKDATGAAKAKAGPAKDTAKTAKATVKGASEAGKGESRVVKASVGNAAKAATGKEDVATTMREAGWTQVSRSRTNASSAQATCSSTAGPTKMPKVYNAFTAAELERVLLGMAPKPARHITAVYATGLSANRVSNVKRLLAGNCGVPMRHVPHIGFIGRSIAEFHVFVDFAEEFKRRVNGTIPSICFIELEALDPALFKDAHVVDAAKEAAAKVKRRLEARLVKTPVPAHRRFLERELKRAESQLNDGVFMPQHLPDMSPDGDLINLGGLMDQCHEEKPAHDPPSLI